MESTRNGTLLSVPGQRPEREQTLLAIAIAVVVVVCCPGCQRGAQEVRTTKQSVFVRTIDPLRVGMTRTELLAAFPDMERGTESHLELGTPSNMLETIPLSLPTGLNVSVLLNHDRVEIIRVSDARFMPLSGVTTTITFKELKRRFPNAGIWRVSGYGTVARVGEEVWVTFLPESYDGCENIADEARASFIDIRTDF